MGRFLSFPGGGFFESNSLRFQNPIGSAILRDFSPGRKFRFGRRLIGFRSIFEKYQEESAATALSSFLT
jgi:hypothetical protein